VKDQKPIKLTIIVPAELNERFRPEDNKAAFIREAIKEKLDKRDGK